MIEIIIITYNRAEKLRRTLDAIVSIADLVDRITVLDNCSTDETASVSNGYGALIKYKKNRFNIGLEANILRAWETAISPYLWVLCDDDEYVDLRGGIESILHAIKLRSPDIILTSVIGGNGLVGDVFIKPSKPEDVTPAFFGALSFPPAVIIKTELFRSEDFFNGYRNIKNYYSYMCFFGRLLQEESLHYVAPHSLVVRPLTAEVSFPLFDVSIGWMLAQCFVPEKFHSVSMFAILDPYNPKSVCFKGILRQRLDWNKETLIPHVQGILQAPRLAKRTLWPLLIFSFLPKVCFSWIRKLYEAYKRFKGIKREKASISRGDVMRG